MQKYRDFVAWLCWIAVFASGFSQAQTDSSSRDRATFVLEGKVVDVTQPEKGSPVATVQVSNAKKTPPSIGDLPEGQSVRVILQKDEKLNKGSTYTFYATGAGASDVITLRELAHGPVLPANIVAFTAIEPNVVQHYMSADVLLRARVLATPPLSASEAPSSSTLNEHAARYKKVSLQVDEVVRGQLQHSSGQKVEILIPTNPDVAYASSSGQFESDITPGSTKIFALNWDAGLKSYVAGDRVDVQPLSELQEIKSAVHQANTSTKKPR
jgi:hypothetical protein